VIQINPEDNPIIKTLYDDARKIKRDRLADQKPIGFKNNSIESQKNADANQQFLIHQWERSRGL
jgi:hypothetical protein